jgi:hypothetical protein
MINEKILGYTLQDWVEMIDSDEAENAEKALEYYDGDQYEAMEELLSHPAKGRKKWRERGIIPRFRNITQMVVEKSGKLFKDKSPTIQIFDRGSNQVNEDATNTLLQELEKTDYLEFFNNLDSTTRLLKTTAVLVQWDTINRELAFELLHRGNCAIVMDSMLKNIMALIYKTSEMDDIETYRIITVDEYIDIIEEESEITGVSNVAISERIPNPYGIIPLAFFHDTRTPRNCLWNKPGMDLVSLNELYNLHLTDSEYAISWSKLPTLFTNCAFGESGNQQLEVAALFGEKLPHYIPKDGSELIGGPSRVIQLDSNGVDSPFIEYKSPQIDIKPLDEVVTNWMDQFAADWSVRMVTGGTGSANSGFQLVVEELPNRELRQQRAKMFTAGFKRLYKIISQVINTQYGFEYLPFNSDAYIEFPIFELPVDESADEIMWSERIKSGRASIIDYLMAKQSLTKEEAISKAQEIASFNNKFLNINSNINQP